MSYYDIDAAQIAADILRAEEREERTARVTDATNQFRALLEAAMPERAALLFNKYADNGKTYTYAAVLASDNYWYTTARDINRKVSRNGLIAWLVGLNIKTEDITILVPGESKLAGAIGDLRAGVTPRPPSNDYSKWPNHPLVNTSTDILECAREVLRGAAMWKDVHPDMVEPLADAVIIGLVNAGHLPGTVTDLTVEVEVETEIDITELVDRAVAWKVDRIDVMERESGSSQWADEVHNSDDEGCAIADALAEIGMTAQ
jgi:hypothetical protein